MESGVLSLNSLNLSPIPGTRSFASGVGSGPGAGGGVTGEGRAGTGVLETKGFLLRPSPRKGWVANWGN